MDEKQFSSWLFDHSIKNNTEAIIRRIRISQPSRNVDDGRSNVTGRYPSQKMGHTIQFESHKVELAFLREYEFDDKVLEYYDQPEPIKITYQASSGRRVAALTTPDFFVIRNDGTAGWEECKPEQDLEKLSQKSERFSRDEKGQWRCPPGEEYASQFGLYFRVRSSSEINWIWQRNIEYLSDYIQSVDHQVPPDTESLIKAVVSRKQGILLNELVETAETYSVDHILQLIASNELYVNLQLYPLSEQDRVPVYTAWEYSGTSKTTIHLSETHTVTVAPGVQLIWDGKIFKIVNTGEGNIWLQDEQSRLTHVRQNEFEKLLKAGAIREVTKAAEIHVLRELLSRKSPKAYAEANRKYAAIAPYLSGETTTRPTSTIYDWLGKYRKAESLYGYGYLGLLGSKAERGNRLPKLPAKSYELMKISIDEQYLTTTETSPSTVYGHYRNLCEKSMVIVASFKTFMLHLKQLDAVDTELKRKGQRSAYQLELFYWELEMTTPRHGDRPFEIIHIDHTELDIELVDSITGENFGRPWLTLMMDANTRRILAFILSYESPSYRSCMMVIRECVRIHNRLPQTIVVDRGAEFNGVYFEKLLAFHNITKKNRPRAKPRYGSVMERLFGTTNEQFIHALVGNTKIMVNVRQVTKSVNPANLAIWTLPKLVERIGRYFTEIYDDLDHPALGESPRKAFERGLTKHGIRSMKFVHYDDVFILNTLPSTPKGHAKAIRSRGIKINNFYYWHEALRFVTGQNIQVRYDPYDVGVAYAFVRDQWVRCRSEYYALLHGRSEKEMVAITQEIKKRRSTHHQKIVVNAQKIAAFIAETQGTELELKAMRRAAEMRDRNSERPMRVENEIELPALSYDLDDIELYEELTV